MKSPRKIQGNITGRDNESQFTEMRYTQRASSVLTGYAIETARKEAASTLGNRFDEEPRETRRSIMNDTMKSAMDSTMANNFLRT